MFLQYHIGLSQHITLNQSIWKKREECHTRWLSTIHQTHIPTQRKGLEIVKMTVSWKRFNNRREGDFSMKRAYSQVYITPTCVMFDI